LGLYGRAAAVLVLGWTAGYIDAVGYLELAHVYTSHMTGNTAALGQYLSRAQWPEVLQHAWPILTFVFGLMLGAALTEAGRRRRFHSRLSLVLGLEMILLAVLVIWSAPGSATGAGLWWVGLPALAMGLQTVTITRVGDQRVYSTYITGNLSKFAEALTGYSFWLADCYGQHRRSNRRQRWLREALRHRLLGHALLTGGLWTLFLLGGLSGAERESRLGLAAVWWPIAVLGALIAVDLARPITAVADNEPIAFQS
jgi:uncharacterized membrane protein YoaK (UPF0700 family)